MKIALLFWEWYWVSYALKSVYVEMSRFDIRDGDILHQLQCHGRFLYMLRIRKETGSRLAM